MPSITVNANKPRLKITAKKTTITFSELLGSNAPTAIKLSPGFVDPRLNSLV